MISPGYMREDKFVNEITRGDKVYLLPEYITGFLLAKNIAMQFR